MAEPNDIAEVQKVLGNPISGEYGDNALKIRRNLMVVSVVTIGISKADVRLDPTSSILGFKFIGLTDDLLRIGLLITCLYLVVHFGWYAIEAFSEWRVRVTGTRLAFRTGAKAGSIHADYPDDPRQSTLYTWWIYRARQIGNISSHIKATYDSLERTEAALKSIAEKPEGAVNIHIVAGIVSETRNSLGELKRAVENETETLAASRIPVSLARFDGWFQLLLRSQNLRWLVVETLLPLCLGMYAIALLRVMS